jgi:hypothetical protein
MKDRDEFIKLGWERMSSMPVWVVAMPLPPGMVGGGSGHKGSLIYMPDSFMSSVFDNDHSETSSEFKVITIKPTENGPAVLARVELSDILELNTKPMVEMFNGHYSSFTTDKAAICASTEFYPLIEDNGAYYTDKVDIVRLNFMHGSCNKRSHIVVPKAPYLTALLQYTQSPNRDTELIFDRKYLSPQEGHDIFPEIDFSLNVAIDQYVSQGIVNPAVSFYNRMALGDWALPLLRQMRRNAIVELDGEIAHGILKTHVVSGVASQKDDREVAEVAIAG